MKMNKKGFTLIEMLVVIAIIAVLVSIIIPVVSNSTTKAQAAADAANLRSTLSSVTITYIQNGNALPTGYSIDLPEAKTADVGTMKIYKNGEALDIYFVNGTTTYSIEYFADIAEGVTTGATAAGSTSTAGTLLYPAA